MAQWKQVSTVKTLFRTLASNVGINLLTQVATLLFIPLLSHVYDLESYGRLTVFLTLSALLGVFAGYRLDVAALSAESQEETHRLLSMSVSLAAGVSAVFLAFELIPGLRGMGVTLALAVPLAAVVQAATCWLIQTSRITLIAVGRLLGALVMGSVQLLLGHLQIKDGLLWGLLAGLAVNALFLLTLWRPTFQRFSLRTTLWDYRAFGVTSAVAAAVNALTLQAPQVLLASLFGPAAAGAYAIAQRLTTFPVTLLAQPLSQSYTGKLSTALRLKRPMAPVFQQYAGVALGLGVVLALGISVAAPLVLHHFLSSDWRRAEEFLWPSAALLIPTLLMGSVGLSLNLMQRTTAQFRWDVARLIAVGAVFALAAILGLPASLTVWLFVGVLVVFAAVYMGLVLNGSANRRTGDAA